MKRNLLNLTDLAAEELLQIIDLSGDIKKNPIKYKDIMSQKTLLMIFEKPSLRTRVSFEVAMTKMGGHAIYYDTKNSPMGVGETIADTAKCASRYVDIIMARLFRQADTIELARHSEVPVIDALSDIAHPCQIIADLMTIKEKKGRLKGLKLAYFGDADNNVTYSLMQGCSMVGIDICIATPQDEEELNQDILKGARSIAKEHGSKITITKDAIEAAKDADIITTDTWMSYHIPKEEKEGRVKRFMPYQVNNALMSRAKKDAIFMHCLPAKRDYEVTDEIVDGPQSVVFDEAENRMWTEMAVLIHLIV
ncbi:MAG: ornithine carbamoyltransferase [Candidatus Woesearchaeota archaeon]|nr:ornithine carbamoyltransferase [Candidatus Woesearchaeota archaeon]